jgi:DNA-binding NarL/FixJ family response regulator
VVEKYLSPSFGKIKIILSNPILHEGRNMFKILLVEDNANLRQSLKNIIQMQFPSMVIEEAGDGIEALRKVHTLLPDLVFMNIGLPGESGIEVTKRIKKDFPGITVVILTSYDLPEYRNAAFECGATYFITKDSLIWEEIEALIRSISSELNNAT